MTPELERLKQALAGRYQLDRELGRGGMATVYLAHDLRHSRAVAVKVLRGDLIAALGPERFAREIAVTARLDHPHILSLLDSGSAEGLFYYVMPFVEGQSLRDRLARERQLPLEEALAITRELADALNYAHDLGVIHRDVKPENVLLAGGHARLADFGIARLVTALNASDSQALTGTGVMVGTPAYMSPEQAVGDRDVDRRTDVYSLAAVTYEMLAGQPPHTGATLEAVVQKKLREPVSSLTVVRDAVPPEVDEAVRKALARVPADRFTTTVAYAEALERGRGAARPQSMPQAPRSHATTSASATTHLGVSVPPRRRAGLAYPMTVLLAAAVGAGLFWYFGSDADSQWLAAEALPLAERALDVADFESAYAVANEIRTRMPDSPELAELWPRLSWRVTLDSVPRGAKAFRQAFNSADAAWEELGVTPLVDIRFPFGVSRLRFELDGYRPLERAIGGGHLNWEELTPRGLVANAPDMLLVAPETFKLDSSATLPADKVRVPGWPLGDGLQAREFLLGRYEVTNAEYKAFVDAGGYRRRELWDPIVVNGRALGWDEAMRTFVDRTGRPGPSTWEAGDYGEGQEAYPVAGVSWYEASAYARFVGQELPTAPHWQQALANSMFPWLLPVSNFGGQGPSPVGESRAMTHVGAYDLTGNVREWTSTAVGAERIILGGSWNDPYYLAGATETATSPADRSPSNGFRLAVTEDEPAVAERLRAPIERTAVSTAEQPPVSDEVYAAYGRVFDYQQGPLNASVERVDRTRIWTRERVAFDAGYGAERVLLHLYLPVAGQPPYQTVVYWPGWDTFALDDIDEYFAKQLDFVVKSGRAVAFPIYKGIFDRRVGNVRRRPDFNTAGYRDNVIDGVKDLRRTIDYLETRSDIEPGTLAFFGYSWGGVNGPVALAQEGRLRTAVIDIGMLPPMSNTPEVDPVNALPRVRQPTLMISGEFDPMIPVANARRYFTLIGTPPANKRHVVVVGGHFVPRDLLIREVLDWLDKHASQAGS
jgi:formylglycine-generating enzyme required for sulfatase activity/predicted esterase